MKCDGRNDLASDRNVIGITVLNQEAAAIDSI